MKPILQTIEAAQELERYQPGIDVLGDLQTAADTVQSIVPDCVGMSVAWLEHGVTFTLVASDEEIATLDAVQYLAGGPCVDAVRQERGLEVTGTDLFDEEAWRLFARATAARTVRSTLTLLLTEHGRVAGSINLYAASDHAFEGHHEELCRHMGSSASQVVSNADLDFSTRRTAELAPARLQAQRESDVAIGMIAAAMRITPDEAAGRLVDAARRAGIGVEQLARALVELRP